MSNSSILKAMTKQLNAAMKRQGLYNRWTVDVPLAPRHLVVVAAHDTLVSETVAAMRFMETQFGLHLDVRQHAVIRANEGCSEILFRLTAPLPGLPADRDEEP